VVIAALQKYAADGASTANFEYINLDHIRTDAAIYVSGLSATWY
jgi:hypothetical protein